MIIKKTKTKNKRTTVNTKYKIILIISNDKDLMMATTGRNMYSF